MKDPMVGSLPGWVKYLAIAAFIFAVYVSVSSFFMGPDKPELSPEMERHRAQIIESQRIKEAAFFTAQDFVRANLKAPSTADFPSSWSNSAPRDLGDGLWYVHSYVDSENAMGAKLRTFYICELRTNDSGKNWKLEKLVFDE